MEVSIVIPTIQHLNDYLKPCIESIELTTDLTDKEVIVVANGSDKATHEYVESLGPPFKLLKFDYPLGAPRAYNEGMKVATGKYVILLNDDVVIFHPVWMEMLLRPFDVPEVGLTGVIKFTLPVGKTIREAFAFWCVMIRKEVIEKIGYLDEIFYPFGCEDIDFCIRAANVGYQLVQVPENTSNKFLIEPPKGETFPIFHRGSGTVDEYFNDIRSKKLLEDRNLRIIYDRYGD